MSHGRSLPPDSPVSIGCLGERGYLEIKPNKLGQVISGCWDEAESSLAKLIALKYPNPTEELITDLLAAELRQSVARASGSHKVEHAFLEDLEEQVPNLNVSDARRFGGLIASVAPHNKSQEGKVSAADLGILILRPQVWLNGWDNETIECSRDYATGLLAQAKLGHRKKRRKGYSWNTLQKKQEQLFPNRRAYYSLLLYRLKGKDLNEFDPLRWQLCHESETEDLKQWLRTDLFPEEKTSSDILRMLFDGQIGTKDRETIQSVIAPPQRDPRVIEIRIFWPDGSGPPPSFHLEQQHHQQEDVQRRCGLLHDPSSAIPVCRWESRGREANLRGSAPN
ncbi:MAG: hypothetical protein ABSE82_12745 [Nitrososphaerales archaeon]